MRTATLHALLLPMLAGVVLCACAAPGTGAPPVATVSDPAPRDAMYQRFIVKYRDGSAPLADTRAVQQRLQDTAPSGLDLRWQRRLGVQADVFLADRPLAAREAEALMARFRADPEVEYIEPDGMVALDPVERRVRPLQD